ncbi:MAG TPA: hypothetical protein DCX25_04085 [Candidatus Pacebacteria bacterium]|nr:MAG: Peptidase M23 family protein [Microgenomates group bacterium GW2011_GWB1_45_17]KKU23062.1 MAG: Peptidase M23 family protein [Microgenomates group bacterium GW2011_GWA1_46_15]KKU23735.1 MAG: Peptidase M23 family protein [Microgenomates group bacterium GW2011_GWC1_46_15]HAV15483.1 hypothetical protein [Candidatus Paceibacterota bacterium]HCR11728.1 hypothetical protein [Candidatus Paceibacterota bacterium]
MSVYEKHSFMQELRTFSVFFMRYVRTRLYSFFAQFEKLKDVIVDLLYKRRGKYTRPFLHIVMTVIAFVGITLGPLILQKVNAGDRVPDELPSGVLSSATDSSQAMTTVQGREVVQYRGGEVITHEVKNGETVESIARLYNLKPTTILWLNKLNEKKPLIKPGQQLKILPVDGVLHKVKKGETIYTIAKLYGLEDTQAQGVVDYPFNTFTNDETFALSVGQDLVIPDGMMPAGDLLPPSSVASVLTPNAGSVSPTGSFVWPASGRITQDFRFYHKGTDIANRSGGNVLAADSGKVIVAGWIDNAGYGNRIIIDHGNGYSTLYAHLALIQVQVGQTVRRGDIIGQMGSTGRSTGTHLHFEIRRGGVHESPLSYLK